MTVTAGKRQPYGQGGRVRQLPSGRWQARFLGPDGVVRPAPETFDTKLDAGAWIRGQAADAKSGAWQAPEPGPHKRQTFRDYALAWIEGRDIRPRTRSDYRKALDDLIFPTFGDVPLDRIKPASVRVWFESLDPSKPTTRARAYQTFHAIMNTAYRDDLIVANPCRVEGGGNTRRKRDIRPATLKQIAMIAEEMPDRYRFMVYLAAFCALRYGELTGLTRADLDIEAATVSVRRSITRVGGRFVVNEPKTAAGWRTVAIPEVILTDAQAHLDRFVGGAIDALLFPARHGGFMAPSSLNRVYYPAREAAGRTDLRFHDLRHTAATLAAINGATIADLMKRLGHASPQAAMIYQHAAQDRDAMIAAGLSDMVASALPQPIATRGKSRSRRAARR